MIRYWAKPILSLRVLVLLGLGIFHSVAFGQLQIQLVKECTNAPSDQVLKKGDSPGKSDLEHFNTRCDQQRLLKEGNDVTAVFMLDSKKKADLVRDGIAAGTDVAEYQKDGTCFKGAAGQPDETGDQCVRRLERAATDAEVFTRKALLDNNKARTDLISGKGALGLCDNKGQSTDPNNKDCVMKNPSLSSETVLKDFNDAYKKSKTPQGANLQLYKLMGTTNVTFGNHSGDAVLNADPGATTKVKTIDIKRDVNDEQGVAEQVSQTGQLQTDSGSQDGVMEKALATAKANMGAAIKSDQTRENKAVAALPPNQPLPDLPVGVSRQAFQDTMADLAQKAKDQGGIGSTLDEINNRSVDVNYNGDGLKPNEKAQDQVILDMLRDPASSTP